MDDDVFDELLDESEILAHDRHHATQAAWSCRLCLDDDARDTYDLLWAHGITVTRDAYLRLGGMGQSLLGECLEMLTRQAPSAPPPAMPATPPAPR